MVSNSCYIASFKVIGKAFCGFMEKVFVMKLDLNSNNSQAHVKIVIAENYFICQILEAFFIFSVLNVLRDSIFCKINPNSKHLWQYEGQCDHHNTFLQSQLAYAFRPVRFIVWKRTARTNEIFQCDWELSSLHWNMNEFFSWSNVTRINITKFPYKKLYKKHDFYNFETWLLVGETNIYPK